MYEKKTALQKLQEQADATDRRRQRQIEQQSVRMDNMKLIILSMAATIQAGDDPKYSGMSIEEIISAHTE